MRTIDDRIISALNASLPTQSFRGNVDTAKVCKRFYDQLQLSYEQRAKSITRCLEIVNNDVETLRQKKSDSPDDIDIIKTLRKEQTKFRLLQQEMGIEEVVKDRTLKVFYERCRDSFTPPAAPVLL